MAGTISNFRASRVLGFMAPLLTATLLVAMVSRDPLRVDPHVADAFHARAAKAVSEIPATLWPWTSVDLPIPKAAVTLLKPNAMLCRRYQNRSGVWATLLLTQCRDCRDMLGHYPPVCYRGQGYEFAGRESEDWDVGAMIIPGIEYRIHRQEGSVREDYFVRDFFVLPNGKIVRDMDGVTQASKNYRALAFGVAQIQLLCDARLTRDQRDQIFLALIGANTDVIKVLGSADTPGGKL